MIHSMCGQRSGYEALSNPGGGASYKSRASNADGLTTPVAVAIIEMRGGAAR
jgi:hypothetical protein